MTLANTDQAALADARDAATRALLDRMAQAGWDARFPPAALAAPIFADIAITAAFPRLERIYHERRRDGR